MIKRGKRVLMWSDGAKNWEGASRRFEKRVNPAPETSAVRRRAGGLERWRGAPSSRRVSECQFRTTAEADGG